MNSFDELYGNFTEGTEIGDTFDLLYKAIKIDVALTDEQIKTIQEIMKDIIKDTVEWRIANKDQFPEDFDAIQPAWVELLEQQWKTCYRELKNLQKHEN